MINKTKYYFTLHNIFSDEKFKISYFKININLPMAYIPHKSIELFFTFSIINF